MNVECELNSGLSIDNRAYTNVRTILPFPVVEAFIRLGKKYDVAYLRNEGLVRLQICFPAVIEHYEANCLGGGLVYGVQPHNPMGGSETIFKALNLALECGVYTVIPAMYLNLVQNVVSGSSILLGFPCDCESGVPKLKLTDRCRVYCSKGTES